VTLKGYGHDIIMPGPIIPKMVGDTCSVMTSRDPKGLKISLLSHRDNIGSKYLEECGDWR